MRPARSGGGRGCCPALRYVRCVVPVLVCPLEWAKNRHSHVLPVDTAGLMGDPGPAERPFGHERYPHDSVKSQICLQQFR